MHKKIVTILGVAVLFSLAGCGDTSSPEKAAAPAATSSTPAPAVEKAAPAAPAAGGSADGAALYQTNCFVCHGPTAPAVQAPQVGVKANWEARIANGMDALYTTAINGSTKNPVMAPRGGTALSDGELKAVVDYMVAQSK